MRDFRLTVRVVMRWMAAGCVLLLAFRVCVGQDLRYFSQQVWSTEEGLPQSSVHSVVQSGDGYLWIGTEGGLVRFDGVSFRVYGRGTDKAFVSDDICCLVADGADGLWVGTADGAVRMVGHTFQRFGVGEGLPSAMVLGMRMQGGSVVVETAGALVRWDGRGFKAVAGSGSAESMAGAGGAIWSYDRAGVAVVRGGVTRSWHVGGGLPAGRVQTLYVDREGLAWVGMNDGLFVLDAAKAAATAVAAVGQNSVLSIFEDEEGNHWVGTETSGLHVLRRLNFRSEPGLADKAVTSVAQTSDGAMWVGTREDGLRRVRGGVVDEPVAVGALASPVILCLAPGIGGGLWVGTPDGLDLVDARGSVRRIALGGGLPDETIRSLAAERDGSVWAGTQHGLVHVSGAGVKTLTSAEGLGGDMVGSLLLAGRVLWAGTSGGVSRVAADERVTNFTTKDGLGGEIATAMAVDGAGELWVATKGGGLSWFDGRRFVATGAVPAEVGIDGMRVDGAGYLWMRMERGVGRVAVSALHDCVKNGRCAAGVVARYGLADGLPNDEVVAVGSPALWLAVDGEMWFATRGGVAVADAKEWGSTEHAPPAVVERFLVDDVAEPSGAGEVQIPFGHGRFTIEYAGLNFTAPSEVRYRFRLEGFDKDWVYAGGRRSAFYTNLGPGWYRFVVETANGDGVWSATGADVRFRIVPPFYRRWWFIALMVLAGIALLVGLYLLRLRLLRREFDAVLAERNRMAREIHDTLTQDFVGTSLQLDLVSQQLARGKVEIAIEQVRRTRQMVTEGLTEARQSIWELRANSSQDSLPTRLTRLVQREAFATVAPKLRVGGAYRVLDLRVEREVLRIAQEAMSNVVHHAQATEATVELQYASDTLMLMIGDNGAGFAVDESVGKAGHYGLLGMRERAAMIDGTLEIASEPGQGTRITLRVPTAQSGR